jgi:hypothetical protein
MSPQALLLAERIVCNKTKAIGSRRCNTILINAGVDPSRDSQHAERTFAAANHRLMSRFVRRFCSARRLIAGWPSFAEYRSLSHV